MRIVLLTWLVILLPVTAFAADGVVPLVSVEGLDRENTEYWWQESESRFSTFDQALAEAISETDVQLVRPKTTDSVSKIYRQPELSDANAATLAGILGARWAIVGKARYEKAAALGPSKLPGVHLTLEARLVERSSDGGFRVRDVIEITRTTFDPDLGKATRIAERELASRVAWLVSSHRSNPVANDESVPLEGPWLVLHRVPDGRTLDTILRALRGNAAISSTQVGWVDGRRIAIELRSDAGDLGAADIRSIAASVASTPESGFSLEALPSRNEGLIEFEVQLEPESL